MQTSDYRSVVEDVYAEAAAVPQPVLCCTQTPTWKLPGLVVPEAMLERNYGCGTTVHPRDVTDVSRVLYVGVGAGMEALHFAYFTRRAGGVVAVDTNEAMLATARELLEQAARVNDWFEPEMVELRHGDALALPVESDSDLFPDLDLIDVQLSVADVVAEQPSPKVLFFFMSWIVSMHCNSISEVCTSGCKILQKERQHHLSIQDA